MVLDLDPGENACAGLLAWHLIADLVSGFLVNTAGSSLGT